MAGSRVAEAQSFWTAFRAAVAFDDDSALAGMTRLPLRLRGEMDDDPVRRVPAADLPEVIDEVLEQRIYPASASAAPQSLREIVQRLERLPDHAWLTPTSFRVEQLEFQRVKGRWALVQAYLAE